MKNYKPLIAICFGYFMIIIDVTIVNVAVPAIAKNLHIGLSNLEWLVDAYTLTFAALLLTTGSLSDRYGAKKIFQLGLFIFILASILCGVAINFQSLLLFRLLQGIGAALLVPTSISLIHSSYSDKSEFNKAIGAWAAIAGVAAATGPIIGAIITSVFNWRGIFFINIPLGMVCLYLTQKWVAKSEAKINHIKFDFGGQILGIISVSALAYGLIEVSNRDMVFIAIAIFIASFIGFILVEHLTIIPMLPLKLFKSKDFSVSILIGFILNLGFYGQLFLLPLYFHQVKSYSIFLSGLAIAPEMLLVAFGSYLSGKFMHLLGAKKAMVIGLVIACLGLLGVFISINYSLSYSILVVPLLLVGLGTSFTMPAVTIASIKSVATNQTGIAGGVLNTARQIGNLVGVALFGTITGLSTSLNYGVQHALICACSVFLFGIMLVLL